MNSGGQPTLRRTITSARFLVPCHLPRRSQVAPSPVSMGPGHVLASCRSGWTIPQVVTAPLSPPTQLRFHVSIPQREACTSATRIPACETLLLSTPGNAGATVLSPTVSAPLLSKDPMSASVPQVAITSIIGMVFMYGTLFLSTISRAPLPPAHRCLALTSRSSRSLIKSGSSFRSGDVRPVSRLPAPWRSDSGLKSKTRWPGVETAEDLILVLWMWARVRYGW